MLQGKNSSIVLLSFPEIQKLVSLWQQNLDVFLDFFLFAVLFGAGREPLTTSPSSCKGFVAESWTCSDFHG